MKNIRLTRHAREQCNERGASEAEVREAIIRGRREAAKRGRFICRYNFQYNAHWQKRFYAVKQVAPVIVEEDDEIIVVTVYTFYF